MTDGRRQRSAARYLPAIAIATTLATYGSLAQAQSQADFFAGKSIRVIIGFDPGGGYDTYARLAARHLARHVPGNPSFVPQNMPGGGGITSANHLYNVAPKDGTAMGALHVNVAFNQVVGGANLKYDARRFIPIGRMTGTMDVHYSSAASGVKSFADLKQRQVVVAGTGPASNSVVYPRVMNELLGTKLKILAGFKGTTAANLAMERGEADMVLKPWEAIKSGNAEWLRDGKIHLIVQYSLRRGAELKNVPTILEVSETDEQRQIFELLVGSSEIGRFLTYPPDVPADRVAVMRAAFMAMVADPQLKAEAEKLKMDLDPLDGAELQKLVDRTFAIPAPIVEKAKALLKPN